jgi:hypothetical protein
MSRDSRITVGELVFVPNLLPPDHPGYASAAEVYRYPGRVVSVEDDWAMVDLGHWGQVGRPVGQLRPAAG